MGLTFVSLVVASILCLIVAWVSIYHNTVRCHCNADQYNLILYTLLRKSISYRLNTSKTTHMISWLRCNGTAPYVRIRPESGRCWQNYACSIRVISYVSWVAGIIDAWFDLLHIELFQKDIRQILNQSSVNIVVSISKQLLCKHGAPLLTPAALTGCLWVVCGSRYVHWDIQSTFFLKCVEKEFDYDGNIWAACRLKLTVCSTARSD